MKEAANAELFQFLHGALDKQFAITVHAGWAQGGNSLPKIFSTTHRRISEMTFMRNSKANKFIVFDKLTINVCQGY